MQMLSKNILEENKKKILIEKKCLPIANAFQKHALQSVLMDNPLVNSCAALSRRVRCVKDCLDDVLFVFVFWRMYYLYLFFGGCIICIYLLDDIKGDPENAL